MVVVVGCAATMARNLGSKMSNTDYDIFVIGGGVNGASIARDAVGRGFSVGLCEMNDLASGTSSGSTKLIHGGLRYLEHYEFRLVREALMEREVLWATAPHIIWPLRFVLPHNKELRPQWMLRLGLFLYDHLGGRRLLPPTRVLDLTRDAAGKPLRQGMETGFEYSDCWVQDARLTVLIARDAARRGADIMVRTACTDLTREGGHWRVRLEGTKIGESRFVTARLVVNAAGPWVDRLLRSAAHQPEAHNVRLVQGSHIVVPRLFDHDRCYIFQNGDGRIVFAIPFEQDFTLIGTTDLEYAGDPARAVISDEEVIYLCQAASEYFTNKITPADVIWSYAAVRPLFDDGASKAQEATRDYVIRTDQGAADGKPGANNAPLVNIFGGKITTYRRLAESVLDTVEKQLGKRKPAWTAGASLPGGDFPVDGFDDLVSRLQSTHAGLPGKLIKRLARNYGTEGERILVGVREECDLGQLFGADLYEAEVRFLMREEWARTAEDVLWRRTKMGLRLSRNQVAILDHWMQNADFARENLLPTRRTNP